MAPQVLFIHNEHLATEGLLGEAFTECGYDVATFGVVPAERVDDPAGDVAFPDPTRYDVIAAFGERLAEQALGGDVLVVDEQDLRCHGFQTIWERQAVRRPGRAPWRYG